MLEYDKYEKELIKLGYEKHQERVEIMQTLWNFLDIVIDTYNRDEEEQVTNKESCSR